MLALSNPPDTLNHSKHVSSTRNRQANLCDSSMAILCNLMCHRQNGESEEFVKRAIESLIKKLNERPADLEALVEAITSNGLQSTKCVPIERTLDGRLQIAGRKCLPHVIYARIWRWSDLHRNELKPCNNCLYGFDRKKDYVCVNPYHYERVIPTSFSPSLNLLLSNIANSSEVNNSDQSPDSGIDQMHTDDGSQSDVTRSPDPMHEVDSNLDNGHKQKCKPDKEKQGVDNDVGSIKCSGGAGGSSGNAGGSNCGNNGNSNSSNFSNNHHLPCASVGIPGNTGNGNGGSGWGGGNNRRGLPVFNSANSLLQPLPVLTTQRPPEYWCNIAYFELDQQVGELFKVPSHYSRVTVDGYTDPSSPNRFCLGQLSNVHRSEQSEKSRLYIGKGVELDNVGEGDVWIRCLSEFSVFVQSYYLDREAGRAPGDAVHKIYPGAYIKVFDIRQCHEEMKSLAQSAQLAAVHQAAVVVGSLPSSNSGDLAGSGNMANLGPSQSNPTAATTATLSPNLTTGSSLMATAGVGVDDLRRLCMLRLSFVKGWGPDYPRRSIKETPCWIEIQLHRPLQLLDEVLQAMPLNDLKPTRHFFSYFSQSARCPTTAVPVASTPRAAKRT